MMSRLKPGLQPDNLNRARYNSCQPAYGIGIDLSVFYA
jgi:hypothetical protein